MLQSLFINAYALSFTAVAFNPEFDKLRSVFSRLDYPVGLINSTINNFVLQIASENRALSNTNDSGTVRLPSKEQVAANAVRKQVRDLSHKIGVTIQPIFVSKQLGQDLKPKEIKPSSVNQQFVIYYFECDLCDADYVGYTARHRHQRIAEHKNSAIGRHFLQAHGSKDLSKEC